MAPIVPPAALTMELAFEGTEPPAKDTRYVWLGLAVRALAFGSVVEGASRSGPQATSDVDRQSDRAKPSQDRSGARMGDLQCRSGEYGNTRMRSAACGKMSQHGGNSWDSGGATGRLDGGDRAASTAAMSKTTDAG